MLNSVPEVVLGVFVQEFEDKGREPFSSLSGGSAERQVEALLSSIGMSVPAERAPSHYTASQLLHDYGVNPKWGVHVAEPSKIEGCSMGYDNLHLTPLWNNSGVALVGGPSGFDPPRDLYLLVLFPNWERKSACMLLDACQHGRGTRSTLEGKEIDIDNLIARQLSHLNPALGITQLQAWDSSVHELIIPVSQAHVRRAPVWSDGCLVLVDERVSYIQDRRVHWILSTDRCSIDTIERVVALGTEPRK